MQPQRELEGQEPFLPDLGTDVEAPPSNSEADDILDALKNRFIFSPFRTIDLRANRIRPAWIHPARITLIKQFTVHTRNDEPIKEEHVSLEESLTATEFVQKLRRPRDVAREILETHAVSGEIETGVIALAELTGLAPHENREDRALVMDLQASILPAEPPDGIAMLELLEEAADRVAGRGSLYEKTAARMVAATNAAVNYCEYHLADTIAEMERASTDKEFYGKLRASRFDRKVCQWIRKPVPKVASKLAPLDGPAPAPQPVIIQPAAIDYGAIAAVVTKVLIESGVIPRPATVAAVTEEVAASQVRQPATIADAGNALEGKLRMDLEADGPIHEAPREKSRRKT